ncbi:MULTISPECIES: dUTP diphosphatase [Clostridium]|uniref:dUTP diphosphatase n=1 Tax=Clostridium aquiflavi TaxID=3073603 RepID=A0ABU1EI31_9CLOT|nr:MULTISPECIES: dUTP diphosphatase [unclassified Clostridium]MDR5588037.1 dUTP diphosphatase [Clostridium sp. 5N-1]NFG62540.1 dUTPase [Clostridium botulinum]NFQ10741.1 dUTPase [Clostridium botulinum]HBJ1647474.1 dUTP diphosphatase [Clostridium botulinum]
MNVKDLFETQRIINKNLTLNNQLDDCKIQTRKYLEFNVKISELANETKCFKYLMDTNNFIDMQVVFRKYVSCLSQIITIGLDNNYSDITEIDVKPNDYCLSDQFLNLYIDINDLIISPSKDHYLTLFEDILSLAITLGFTQTELKNEFSKNTYEKVAL